MRQKPRMCPGRSYMMKWVQGLWFVSHTLLGHPVHPKGCTPHIRTTAFLSEMHWGQTCAGPYWALLAEVQGENPKSLGNPQVRLFAAASELA